MKTLKDFDLKDKKVLVRCDFNVPIDKNFRVSQDFRIKKVLPTIQYLQENGARIILISHLGRPKEIKDKKLRSKLFSLKPVVKKLEDLLNKKIKFLDDCIGEKVKREIDGLKASEILVLENLRFYEEEEKNDQNFAKKLSELADIFIEDAFSVCHRNHASIVGIPKFLPSGAGFLVEKEIKVLSKALKNPWQPLVVIIGGIKISTKIKTASQFYNKADHLLFGGEIANFILRIKGISGRCLASAKEDIPSPEIIEKINKFDLTNPGFHLPIDVVVSPDKTAKIYIRVAAPGDVRKDEMILDIGPETINIFSEIIKTAKMIIWSGPLGFSENENFEKGTKEIAQAIVKNYSAFKIAGGGETISAISKFNLIDRFEYISTGGGAMLKFLSGEKLPGIEILE